MKKIYTILILGFLLASININAQIQLPHFIKTQLDTNTLIQNNTFCFDKNSNEVELTSSRNINKICYCLKYEVKIERRWNEYLYWQFEKVFPDKKVIKKYTKFNDYWIEESYNNQLEIDTLWISSDHIIIDSADYITTDPIKGEMADAKHLYYKLNRKR